MAKIKSVKARQVFDSRGFPTVEAEVTLENGAFGRAIVPSGASTGALEAVELRDGGDKFAGKGVSKAVGNVNDKIAPEIIGFEASDQSGLDRKLIELDGTEQKSNFGANAILSVSLASAYAEAGKEPFFKHIAKLYKKAGGKRDAILPVPMVNVLNGGAHASGGVDIQEVMLMPASAKDFNQAMEIIADVFHSLKKQLKDMKQPTTVGDEGGFAPNLNSNEEALGLLVEAIEKSRFKYGKDVKLALDIASSEFYEDKKYKLSSDNTSLSSKEMVSWVADLAEKYQIISIEDGLAEDDWEAWRKLNIEIGNKLQLVGDDLLVTNPKLLKKAINEKSANAILIKLNQIGTLSETIEAIVMAQQAGWGTVISHRSGETEDVTISHLAVGTGAGQIKTGSLSRGERTAKYNELIRIAELIGSDKLASI
ncbi:MAG TPA: phosphopyruvate hydratase [Candidatus Saccharimonadales bacterium]|nr:phosphopyruvate hydratase [Candidatus Saccharimonadales bacterium]